MSNEDAAERIAELESALRNVIDRHDQWKKATGQERADSHARFIEAMNRGRVVLAGNLKGPH